MFAIFQSVGQLTYIRPFVTDFNTDWLILNSLTLTAGAMILVQVSFQNNNPVYVSCKTVFCALALLQISLWGCC